MLDSKKNFQYKQRIPSAIEQESMAKHTSFRVGGLATLYVVAQSSDELVEAVDVAQELSIPWFVFGGGSNLLVSDDGFVGVMIQAANRAIRIDNEMVFVESGALTSVMARQTVQAGLQGFEWAGSIPGTVGGAVFGNAGCFGGEIKDAIQRVDVYRISDGARLSFSKIDCQFGYRDSKFKHERFVILGGEFQFKKAPDALALKSAFDTTVQKRRENQPFERSSAGCIFKNFDYTDNHTLDILRRSISQIPASMIDQKRLGVGWLVEQVGMKGYKIGDAQVSLQHGNFFLNMGNAKAQDIIALISYVKMKVRDELGIELQEEVQYVGF